MEKRNVISIIAAMQSARCEGIIFELRVILTSGDE